MKRGIVILLFLVLFSSFALATENDCIYHFYGNGCLTCPNTAINLEKLQLKYPALNIHLFEVYYDKTNSQLLQDYFTAYNVPLSKQGLPAVFLSQSYFIGDEATTNYLEKAFLSNKDKSCPVPETNNAVGVTNGKIFPSHLIDTLTFSKLTNDAWANGFNSTGLALLLILIGLLLTARKKVLGTGLSFFIGTYLAYLLFGTKHLSALTEGYYFTKIVGILAILLCLAIILNFGKNKLFTEYKKLGQVFNILTFPAVTFILGFFFSMFTFNHLNNTFSILVSLIADSATHSSALSLLWYFNLVLILPLILITLIIYLIVGKIESHGQHWKFDIHDERNQWKRKYLRYIHLTLSAVLLIVGLILLI